MRLHVPVRLRWSDFDAYQHVNNAEMLRLLEEARIEAFWATDDPASNSELAVIDGRPGSPTISLIARQEVEYLLPIPYQRTPLDIELWIGRLGGASLQICYEIYSAIPDESEGAPVRSLFAKASSTLVMVDAANGKPQRISDLARTAWAPYVEDQIEFDRR
ncbi:acyl-CoA thioesterase [Naasia lichenicola]|uniref:Acyl-CoA thioesterase n=1 Tax=Naasia lichenicola TaxID=2565933 RepID=A0A4S4FEQ4_9MICO|nr:thioesterase family protein [Naasia lichenicola]THG28640.1 acyl-CoA thioesterase [Naasia lichenicola]